MEEFDPGEMNKLFDMGFEKAQEPKPWFEKLPALEDIGIREELPS